MWLKNGREVSQTAAGGNGAKRWPGMDELKTLHCVFEGQADELGTALQPLPLMSACGNEKDKAKITGGSKQETNVLRSNMKTGGRGCCNVKA